MKTFSRRLSRASATLLGLALVAPFLLACGGDQGAAEAQPPVTDSVVAAILGEQAQAPPPAPNPSLSPRLTPQEQATRPLDITQMGYNQGSPDAPVKVMEMSDFGCGYCRQFQSETYPHLKEIYVDGGYVEWKYIPVVMGFPNGLQAAIASECAGEQDQFFPMKVRLFNEQGRWRNADDPYPILYQIAEEEELEMGRFATCIDAGWRENRIRDSMRLARETEIQGTPTFLIAGNVLPGAVPLGTFRDVLDVALRREGVEPPIR